jgi:hypothetical protein
MLWDVTHIRQSARTTKVHQSTNSACLGVASLGELLDRFHCHSTSDRRDKVYALLGMRRTMQDSAYLLQPDYENAWAKLFEETIRHVLGSSVVVTTFEHQEYAVIKGQEVTDGVVTEAGDTLVIKHHRHRSWQRNEGVWTQGKALSTGKTMWVATWKTQPWCKAIKVGDLLWHMHEAAFPSIIRFCRTHFDIIVISLPPPDSITYSYSCKKPSTWSAAASRYFVAIPLQR